MRAREDFTEKVTAEQDLKEVSEQAMPVPKGRAEGTLSTDLGVDTCLRSKKAVHVVEYGVSERDRNGEGN